MQSRCNKHPWDRRDPSPPILWATVELAPFTPWVLGSGVEPGWFQGPCAFTRHCLFNEGNVKFTIILMRAADLSCLSVSGYVFIFGPLSGAVSYSSFWFSIPAARSCVQWGKLALSLVVPPSPEVLALVVNIPKDGDTRFLLALTEGFWISAMCSINLSKVRGACLSMFQCLQNCPSLMMIHSISLMGTSLSGTWRLLWRWTQTNGRNRHTHKVMHSCKSGKGSPVQQCWEVIRTGKLSKEGFLEEEESLIR